MELAKIAVEVRPRTPWEGIDLGFAMARQWFLPLWLLWWASALPLYLLLWLLLAEPSGWLLFLIWWAKPLYEPPLLYWCSRAVFGEVLPLRQVFPRWWSILRPQLLPSLLWRRLSGSRSFHYPVALLEGKQGKERQARLRVLNRRQQAATWLTVMGIHFEILLEVSFLLLVWALLPQELPWFDLETVLVDPDPFAEAMGQIGTLLAMSLVAPFYVAGGFALYLNRRVELEAWDLELHFRRIAERAQAGRAGRRRAAGVVAAVLVSGLAAFDPASALAATTPPQAREIIQEVLAHDDFGKKAQEGYWKYIGAEEAAVKRNPNLQGLFDWLERIGRAIAEFGEVLLWLAAALAAGFAIYWLARNQDWLSWLQGRPVGATRAATVQLFGLDIRPESLPPDIVAAALALLRGGDARGALSLLYRGALAALVHRLQLEIPASATEGECLSLVRGARGGAEAALFDRLTQAWLLTAYAHREPDVAEIEGLCREWGGVFGGGA